MGLKKKQKNKAGCINEWKQKGEKVRQPRGGGLLSEAILRVADLNGTPVACSHQTYDAHQVGQRPRHVRGVVATGKVPSAHLLETNIDKY